MNEATALKDAAELIEREGHFSSFSKTGYCMVTAIHAVSDDFHVRNRCYDFIGEEIGTSYPVAIGNWNDKQSDPSVVIDALNHAAKRAEEAENA